MNRGEYLFRPFLACVGLQEGVRPNIVMGANAQVALEKFARYFEVECRLVPISVESQYRLDPKKAMEYVDENTIGVFVILGSKSLL
jgi:glutamate/tyrosine decarboxylase-like PLP-dependent enzyme